MNRLVILAILFLLCSFSGYENAPVDKEKYETVKTNLQSQRQKFKARYEAASLAGKKVVLSEVGKYLHKSLIDSIFTIGMGLNGILMVTPISPERALLPVAILCLLHLNIAGLL